MASHRYDTSHGANRGAISVLTSTELQLTLATLKGLPSEVRSQVNKSTKLLTTSEWQQEMAGNAHTRLESLVLVNTGRVRATGRNLTLVSGASAKKLAGGATVRDLVRATEFGAGPGKSTYRSVSKRGKAYTVTRNTRAQFRPHTSNGYVVYQAARTFIPRAASLWVQTTMRTTYEAFEKGAL